MNLGTQSDYLAKIHGWLGVQELTAVASDGFQDGQKTPKACTPFGSDSGRLTRVPLREKRSPTPPSPFGSPETKLGQTDSDHEDEHTYPHHEGKPTCSAYDEPIYLDYDEQTYSDYEDEQTYSDSEDSLEPGDSMSQIQQPDLKIPPALLKPTASQLSGLTAGGDQPALYFNKLDAAGMSHSRSVQTQHRHLYEDFSVENLAWLEPDVYTAKAQEDLKRFGRSLGQDGHRSEADLNHEMYLIIRTHLNQESGADEHKYAVGTPGTWNRIPKNISHCYDLSCPTVDLVVGVNPLNPILIPHSDPSLPHPLSPEALILILQNPATANKAPVKSTATDPDFYYTHDSFNLELKKKGKNKKDEDGRCVRSNEMRVAQAQTCNANFVQLGCVAQLYMDVPLADDNHFRRFVLSMTICGQLWTVEYAFRANADLPDTSFATVAQGNWAQQPKVFLGAIKRVLELNMPLLADKALRMAKLLEEAAATAPLEPQPIKIEPVSFAVSPEKQALAEQKAEQKAAQLEAKREAKREAEREAESITLQTHSSSSIVELEADLASIVLHPPENGPNQA